MDAPTESLKKIDADLRLTDEVLRHLIVKCEDGIPSAKYTFKLEAYQEPLTPEGKRAVARKPRVPKPQIPPTAEAVEPISSEELDKKLDEILENDMNA